MPIVKNGKIIEDAWILVGDDEAVPLAASVIVSLTRWQTERGTLIGRNGPLGVRLASGDLAEIIATDLKYLDLIAVEFPAIGDGRGYSIGRLLRQRCGFTGELRAIGPLVRDVFPFLHRCGFDAMEARDEIEAAAWHEAVGAITVAYQPATAAGPRLRHAVPPS